MLNRIAIATRYGVQVVGHVLVRSFIGFCMALSFPLLVWICQFYISKLENPINHLVSQLSENGGENESLTTSIFVLTSLGVLPLLTSRWAIVGWNSFLKALTIAKDKLLTDWIPERVDNNIPAAIYKANRGDVVDFVEAYGRTLLRLVGLISLVFVAYKIAPSYLRSSTIGIIYNSWTSVTQVLQSDSNFYILPYDTLPIEPVNTEDAKVFFLVFFDNAKFSTGDGLNIDEKNQKTLKRFLDAVEECSEESSRVHLVVTGFSSIAPFTIVDEKNGVTSNQLNLKSANLRAKAVTEFLAEEATTTTQKHSVDLPRDFTCGQKYGEKYGLKFDLECQQWNDYQTMHDARPADDGNKENPRVPPEFFNRVVQVEIKNNPCWRKDSNTIKQSTEVQQQ